MNIMLAPQVEARLSEIASDEGVDESQVISKLVTDYKPQPKIKDLGGPDAENQALIELLRGWREEDDTDDEDELALRKELTRELLSNVQANRLSLIVPVL